MKNKFIITILSLVSILFLTAQTCSFGTTTGLALECEGEGDIVCSDDNEAYECGITATGFYTSRSSEDDVDYCGATEDEDTTDTDGDGVYDSDDVCEGYDDADDNDGDLTPDGCDPDDDDDGYGDRLEIIAGSDPNESSSVPSPRDDDDDGMYDIWEKHYHLSLGTDDSGDDEDGDGLTNLEEFEADTDPTNDDTDGDGYSDGDEVDAGTSPVDIADYPTTTTLSAACSVSLATAAAGETITFDGSGSSGTIVIYNWDFGDGNTDWSSDSTFDYSYGDSGDYTATLTVSDGTNTDAVVCNSITVSEAGTCLDADCTYGCNADSTDCATFCEAFSEDELAAIGDIIDYYGGLEGEAIAIAVNDAEDGIEFSLSTRSESDTTLNLPLDTGENAILWELDGVPTFLEGDICYGDECQDAYFIVIDEDGDVHLMQFANINILSNEMDIDDITAGVSDTGLSYTDKSATTISLPNAGFDVVLTVDEDVPSIEFADIWLNAEEAITTYYGGKLKLINNDGTSRIFEGFTFSEYDDGIADSYLQDFGMGASYDATNGIEVNSDIGILAEGTDGYWSLTEGDVTYFLTWKGSIVMYNAVEQSVGLVHPETTSTFLSEIEDCD